MKRRTLLAAAAAFVLGRSAWSQPARVAKIGFMVLRAPPASLDADASASALVRGLRELGYVEGRNLSIEWRYGGGQVALLEQFAKEFVRLKVDVIVAAGNQAITAARSVTQTIPIVIATSIDPVASGFVKSLAHPEGNVTGLSNLTGDIIVKHLEIIVGIVPMLSHVAFLMNPTNSAHALLLARLREAGAIHRLSIVPVEAKARAEFEPAFQEMLRQRVGAVIVALDGLFSTLVRDIPALALKAKLPTIYTTRNFVEAGGLVSYGQNFAENYYRAAAFVDKILKGAAPGSLPVEQSTQFEMVVNIRTAKMLGLALPQDLLLRANQIIE